MAQPPAYVRAFNFANYQASNPSDPLPGPQVDNEFNRVKLTTDAIRANLAMIQRDDGLLKNGIVSWDTISPTLMAQIQAVNPSVANFQPTLATPAVLYGVDVGSLPVTVGVDTSLTANSDLKIPTQKAVKGYVDTAAMLLAGTQTVTGAKTFTQSVAITGAGLELGKTDGSGAQSFIDLHSGATPADYDVRLISTGGTGSAGGGTFNINAAGFTLNGTSILKATDIGVSVQAFNANLSAVATAGGTAPLNYLTGFTLSNNVTDATNDIDIAAGECRDSTNVYTIKLASSITKLLDAAWAVGSGNGGLDTGSIANGVYHLYAIKRLDTNVVDSIFSVSASAPTLPANYTIYRRIGSVIRVGAALLAFRQVGDVFMLNTPVQDLDVATQGTTAVDRVLASVPTGVNVRALIHVRMVNASTWNGLLSSKLVADTDPATFSNFGGSGTAADRRSLDVMTDTSAQVRTRANTASTTVQIWTQGWIDSRGKG